MKTKRIVIIGGPSTGKTTLINHLQELGYTCMPEISRAIIQKAQEKGIEQLFLEDPLLFSEELLKERLKQYKYAINHDSRLLFYDRGLPDIAAYMNYIKVDFPDHFLTKCKENTYDNVFLLPPWEKIHTVDKERYESFEQAKEIHQYLVDEYIKFGHTPIVVPNGTVEERIDYILKYLFETY